MSSNAEQGANSLKSTAVAEAAGVLDPEVAGTAGVLVALEPEVEVELLLQRCKRKPDLNWGILFLAIS